MLYAIRNCLNLNKKPTGLSNGFSLLELLLGDLNYHDVACVDLFQTGWLSFGVSNARRAGWVS